VRSFPACTFEEALVIANAIQQFASGQRVRKLTLFEHLNKSPDSGPSRQLITNSSKYELTEGGYQADYIELTQDGKIATDSDVPPRERLRARFKLAVEGIAPFKSIYDRFKGNKLPAHAVIKDFLTEGGFQEDDLQECVDTFILNAKFLGILKPIAGAERLLPIEHILEEIPESVESSSVEKTNLVNATSRGSLPSSAPVGSWDKTCFYITPIGEPDSEHRMHSDLFLSSIIEPALAEFGLNVVRADQIGKPGMISAQVIEHVVKSKLVIADLSFHNPNVFYELSLRHSCRLPTVQVIRACDQIPFDLDQFRTVKIDTSTIYTLVPSLETYRSEIANQVRRALTDPDSADNPISIFCPGLKVTLNGAA